MTAITVNTNITSLIAQNSLSCVTSSLEKTMQQLSTGLKINSAKDDAAGLAISEAMKAQIRGNTQAMANIQNGLNLIYTTEGGMESTTEDLLRIRELCIEAANNIYDASKKQAIMSEIKQRLENIDVSAEYTTFVGRKLLNGSVTSLTIQTGAGSDKSINSVDIGNVMTNIHTSAGGLNIFLKIVDLSETTPVLTTSAGSKPINGENWNSDAIRAYINKLDAAIDKIASDRSLMGAYSNRLESASANLVTMNENLEKTKSSLTDVDLAQASSDMVKYQILKQASASILIQANSMPQIALQLLGAS